jgi:hypothetical protein
MWYSPRLSEAALRFLNDLADTIRALQEPNIAKYAANPFAESGTTVSELVLHMTRHGLRFAPAISGQEAAYTALHRAMVAYFSPDSSRTWDPDAK